MQTVDFIYNYIPCLEHPGKPSKQCSSVFYESGVLYSYGHHYPLMWAVKSRSNQPVFFVNTRGYSVTTAKHINWAFRAAYKRGIKAHSIVLGRSGSGNYMDPEGIIEMLHQEYQAHAQRYFGLRSNAHRLASSIESRARDIVHTLNALGDSSLGKGQWQDDNGIKTDLLLQAAIRLPDTKKELVAA